ncbi:MAG: DUF4410 domain-containing protein [Verrucomicrobia bacterium]|nr:DUF4410 domain-containing protein [Verrucomicrobiota bacterium]
MDSDLHGTRRGLADDSEMILHPRWHRLTPLLALLGWGCASVSVKDAHEVSSTPIKMPEKIYVQRFSMEGAKVEIDKQGKELEEYKQAVVELLHTRLVDRLPEIAPVEEYKGGPLPTEGWLIQGRFTWVNHGTKAARVLVGFGLGATKMETEVEVTELDGGTPRKFLALKTTGGSNAEPGLAGSRSATIWWITLRSTNWLPTANFWKPTRMRTRNKNQPPLPLLPRKPPDRSASQGAGADPANIIISTYCRPNLLSRMPPFPSGSTRPRQ